MVNARSVLIADDEDSFLQSTAELLREDGYHCDAVPDGHQAAERLRAKRYDLLIADIRMPGNPGLELVRETHQIAGGMPVILITGYPSVESAVQSIELPVVAYLTKPVQYAELRVHVEASLRHSRAYRTLMNVQKHLSDCVDDLDRIRSAGWTPSERPAGATLKVSLATIRSLAACVCELMTLEATVDPRKNSSLLCELLACPQWTGYREVIRRSIGVLEETKNRFKSKDLQQVRELLEGLVEKSEKSSHVS